ncbi:MAG: winged helix DNA-binding domain-containing protein [Candidatus Limnocylindria bacterium]
MPPEVLSRRALNRATLARQLLLERVPIAPADAIHHLLGLQAQTPQSWYLTLWSRLADFDPVATGQLLEERHLVRIALMRSTIHLVTADDALTLRRFTQPAIDRSLRGTWARRLEGVELAELEAAARAFTDESPRTPAELTRLLGMRWPGRDSLTLTNAVRALVPLVQVPPRAVWGRSGAVRLAALETWLARRVPDAVDPQPIVLRYLAAYGPASVLDARQWSGLSHLKEVFERLGPQLIRFRDESGRTLFDLPDAERPDGDVPAPVRFLADYDNVLLSHHDRSRFVDDGARASLTYESGPYPSMLLVDGMLAGQWFVARDGPAATLTVRLARPVSSETEAGVAREADNVFRFILPSVAERTIAIQTDPS